MHKNFFYNISIFFWLCVFQNFFLESDFFFIWFSKYLLQNALCTLTHWGWIILRLNRYTFLGGTISFLSNGHLIHDMSYVMNKENNSAMLCKCMKFPFISNSLEITLIAVQNYVPTKICCKLKKTKKKRKWAF